MRGLALIGCMVSLLLPGIGLAEDPIFIPRQKDCIGDPPRQTEDSLSPPCVAFFDGDNGGMTWRGVDEDEIRVVLYNDLGINGDMNRPWSPADEAADHLETPDKTYLVRTVKAHVRYFASRFHTYGRIVRVTAFSSQGPSSTPAQRTGDAIAAVAVHDPFAFVTWGEGMGTAFEEGAAHHDVLSFGAFTNEPRRLFRRNAPFIWSFQPDREVRARASAGFICDKLAGGTARFTDDPFLAGELRSFGLVYENGYVAPARLLVEALADRCGLVPAATEPIGTQPQALVDAARVIGDFKLRGITTVICYCATAAPVPTVSTVQGLASSVAYRPEWYWDGATGMDLADAHRLYGARDQRSFGMSFGWRQPERSSQNHYSAYLSQEPGTTPNQRWNFDIYHALLNLFTAVQMAGPFIDPPAVAAGLATHRYRFPAQPFTPSGGFDAGFPSIRTFVDSAMAWWWDPSGTPPGGRRGEGCVRVARGGRRSYHWRWPGGDEDLFRTAAPCTGDTTSLAPMLDP